MIVLLLFVSVALIVIACITVLNVLTFSRLDHEPALAKSPRVSVLIPARDEAAVIGHTVGALLSQDYPNFNVYLLDDNSTDGTAACALEAAAGNAALTILPGKPLPKGWGGKNWACHQLGQAADGEWLVFTDADVQWGPGALSALVNEAVQSNADLLTVWPTQHTETWGERLVVPLMALVILGYLPWTLVHRTPWPVFAAANGQCMGFRRRAYHAIGGHQAVKNAIVEDIRLAQKVKSHGLQLRMTDGAGLIACRMYSSWDKVRNGYAKNIIAGYGDSILALGIASVFHWLVFLMPWVWLIFGPRGWGLALVVLSVGIRALTAVATRQRPQDALLMPVSVVLMTRIAAQGVYWYTRFGGPRWKGRTISRSSSHV